MSGAPGNAQTLIMRIFESWKSERAPLAEPSVAFELFASEMTMRSRALDPDEIESGIVGGGQDGGIDAIYVFFDDYLVDEDSELVLSEKKAADFPRDRVLELRIIQAKRTPGFEEDALDKLDTTLRRLLDLGQNLDDLGKLYNELVIARIGLFRSAWEKVLTRQPRVRVHISYAAPGDARGTTPQFEAKRRAVESTVEGQIPDHDGVTFELYGHADLLASYNEVPSYTLPMHYQESVTVEHSHIALVRLRDYYDLIVDEKGRVRRHLFEWNVRDYQGRVSVNQEIAQTLQSDKSPEFWWLNNGVTLICTDATSGGKTFSLTNIQIVNGLQTSYTLQEVLREDLEGAVGNRMILVRIIVTEEAAARDQIIRATNRQTQVTDASLRATDEVQRHIEGYFLTHGWYYDRRKNYYKNEGKDPSKIIGIPLLGAALTASGLSRPDKARGKPSSLLKNDEDYKQAFDPSINLAIYLWVAKTQKRVNDFLYSEGAAATQSEKNNYKFHLATLVVASMLGTRARRPQQLLPLATGDATVDSDEMAAIFSLLREWTKSYLRTSKSTLDLAAKSQRFTDFILSRFDQQQGRIAAIRASSHASRSNSGNEAR